MYEFMTETVIVTQFIFIMMVDAWLCYKAVRWLWDKTRKK